MKIFLTLLMVLSFISCAEKNENADSDNSSKEDIQAILEIKGEGGVTICDCMPGKEPNVNLAKTKEQHDSLFKLLTKHNKACLELEKTIGEQWRSAQKECK